VLLLHGQSLAAVDRNGGVLWRRRQPRKVRDVALGAAELLVLSGDELRVLDPSNGRLGKTLARPRWAADGSLADVERDVAVFVTRRIVRLVRLGDGRNRTIHPPGSGVIHAQLEPAGLFYAYNVRGGRTGRVAFIPFRKLFR
jgi:hypothetical protein